MFYFLATFIAMISVKIITPKLLHKLRIFEKDCEEYENLHKNEQDFKLILP